MSQTTNNNAVKQAFEQSQERKYKQWKTHSDVQKTPEQVAFDDYIATLTNGKVSDAYLTSFNQIDLKEGWHRFSPSTTDRPDVLPEDCYGVMQVIYENDKNKTGTQIIYPINQSMKGRMFSRSVESNKSESNPVLGKWHKYLVDGEVYTKSETYSKSEADGKFATKSGGGSGGGGGSSDRPIPAIVNEDLKTIEGAYSVNLLDYREMSRDPKFKVQGKTFCTNDYQKVNADSPNTPDVKKLCKYNRFRDSENVHMKATLIESSDKPLVGNNDLELIINYQIKAGTGKQNAIYFNYDQVETSGVWNHSNDSYAYLGLQIGGHQHAQKGKIKLEAWYGDEHMKPEGVDQQFNFKEYNGYKLIANHKGTRDVYKHTKWYDCIEKNLGVFNVKDADFFEYELSEHATHNILYIGVPDDCLVPLDTPESEQDDHKRTQYFIEEVMSNNLCDIGASDDDGTLQQRPFFMKSIGTRTIYDRKTRTVKTKYCFMILLSENNMHHWIEHLKETQIVYPLKDLYEKRKNDELHITKNYFKQIPTGGMVYTLNSGESIYTNRYSKISKESSGGGRGLLFSESPFGYPDRIIDADSIASVTKNPIKRL